MQCVVQTKGVSLQSPLETEGTGYVGKYRTENQTAHDRSTASRSPLETTRNSTHLSPWSIL
jgi:hypothetical protein